MLRARYPLAAAMLAATLTIPATTAFAANGTTSPDPVQSTVDQATGSGSSGGTGSGGTSGTDASGGGSNTGNTGSGTGNSSGGTGTEDGSGGSSSGGSGTPSGGGGGSDDPLGGLTGGGGGSSASNPFAGTPLEGVGAALTDPSALPTDLQSLGTCLQGAGSDTTAGQKCFESFFEALGLPASCFSDNNFTLQFALDQLQAFLSGNKQPSQSDLEAFAAQVQGLLTCLTGTPSQSSAPVESGGGATVEPTTTSDVAPAATPVSGTPNFTG